MTSRVSTLRLCYNVNVIKQQNRLGSRGSFHIEATRIRTVPLYEYEYPLRRSMYE